MSGVSELGGDQPLANMLDQILNNEPPTLSHRN